MFWQQVSKGVNYLQPLRSVDADMMLLRTVAFRGPATTAHCFCAGEPSAVEYAVGVAEDGRVTDMQEYQDAYGFVTVAKGKVVDEAAVGLATGTRLSAALRLAALMPQQPVAMESDD